MRGPRLDCVKHVTVLGHSSHLSGEAWSESQTTGILESPVESSGCVILPALGGKVKIVFLGAGGAVNACKEMSRPLQQPNPLTSCLRCHSSDCVISCLLPGLNHETSIKDDTYPSSAHPTNLLPQPLKLRLASTQQVPYLPRVAHISMPFEFLSCVSLHFLSG